MGTVDAGLEDYIRANLGACHIRANGTGAADVLAEIRRRLMALRHPDEPDDPALSYVTEVTEGGDGMARFWFDMADLDELVPDVVDLIRATVAAASVHVAPAEDRTLEPPLPEPEPTSHLPWPDVVRLMDWAVRVDLPAQLEAVGATTVTADLRELEPIAAGADLTAHLDVCGAAMSWLAERRRVLAAVPPERLVARGRDVEHQLQEISRAAQGAGWIAWRVFGNGMPPVPPSQVIAGDACRMLLHSFIYFRYEGSGSVIERALPQITDMSDAWPALEAAFEEEAEWHRLSDRHRAEIRAAIEGIDDIEQRFAATAVFGVYSVISEQVRSVLAIEQETAIEGLLERRAASLARLTQASGSAKGSPGGDGGAGSSRTT